MEQYSRRANLRFQGISEAVEGYEIENTIVNIVNEHMKLSPLLQTGEIERAHRIGRRITEGRPRSVIVRFTTDRRRDATYKARVNFKAGNAASVSRTVFTSRRTWPSIVPNSYTNLGK